MEDNLFTSPYSSFSPLLVGTTVLIGACAIIIGRKPKKQSICVLKKSAKRFDFGG
jgi:hypothetical protein